MVLNKKIYKGLIVAVLALMTVTNTATAEQIGDLNFESARSVRVNSATSQFSQENESNKRYRGMGLRLTGPVHLKKISPSAGWTCTASQREIAIDLLSKVESNGKATATLNNLYNLKGKLTKKEVLKLAVKTKVTNQQYVGSQKIAFKIKQPKNGIISATMSIILYGHNNAKGCTFNYSNDFRLN